MPKKKTQRPTSITHRQLGTIIICLALLLIPLLLLRFPQVKTLFVFFQEVGRVKSASMAIQSHVLREIAVLCTSFGVGYFLRIQKKIQLPVIATVYLLLAYLLYRVVVDSLVYVLISWF